MFTLGACQTIGAHRRPVVIDTFPTQSSISSVFSAHSSCEVFNLIWNLNIFKWVRTVQITAENASSKCKRVVVFVVCKAHT